MNTKKIILSILFLGIIIGFGFVIFRLNNKNKVVDQGNIEKPVNPLEPVEIPTKPDENPADNFLEFGKTIVLKLNDKIVFSDGLNIVLKEINDSRCPKDVQCFWMGEISGAFTISGGNLVSAKEIRLGTVNNKNLSLEAEGYSFSLKDATKTSITIEVLKN